MIRIEGLAVRAGGFCLGGISLEIPEGHYGILMGRTGSGKTMLAECLCGLRVIESGKIVLAGQDVTQVRPALRNIGYVPQDGALFSTMTVRRHLAFPLQIRGWQRADIGRRIDELSQLLALEHLLDRRPGSLSGGEKQRVALGRAIAFHPPILILDEPLSALDDSARRQMVTLLKKIQQQTGVTTLHITHARNEAERLADCLFLLREGCIERETITTRSREPEEEQAEEKSLSKQPATIDVPSLARSPRFRVNPLLAVAVAALLILAMLVYWLPHGPSVDEKGELWMYCAAALRAPIEQIADDYEKARGVRVRIQYGGSNTLLSQIEVARLGDLFLAADETYITMARQKGLVLEDRPLATMRAVLGVPRGNPKGVHRLDQLWKDQLRVVLGNPDQTAIGQATRFSLQASNHWKLLEMHVRKQGVFKPTVGDVANDILLGSVDAGILWDAVAAQYPEIDSIPIPELSRAVADIRVGILGSTKKTAEARRFVRYLTGPDLGLKRLEAFGFQPVENSSHGLLEAKAWR